MERGDSDESNCPSETGGTTKIKWEKNRNWVNKEVYRLLYKKDLYVIAYERIKSKPGNMTPGTDNGTIDGFFLANG
ncbi:hypothetical protein GCM10020331_092310 [Ectobacillus funiculus]